MNKGGPIVIIENDEDDQELLQEIFKEIGVPNKIVLFSEGQTVLDFLRDKNVQPFLILSDISMPLMDGFELREIIRTEPALEIKCIPYLFFTTGTSPAVVTKAYNLSVQGIFQKPAAYDKWKEIIEHIILYWTDCMSPNRY